MLQRKCHVGQIIPAFLKVLHQLSFFCTRCHQNIAVLLFGVGASNFWPAEGTLLWHHESWLQNLCLPIICTVKLNENCSSSTFNLYGDFTWDGMRGMEQQLHPMNWGNIKFIYFRKYMFTRGKNILCLIVCVREDAQSHSCALCVSPGCSADAALRTVTSPQLSLGIGAAHQVSLLCRLNSNQLRCEACRKSLARRHMAELCLRWCSTL